MQRIRGLGNLLLVELDPYGAEALVHLRVGEEAISVTVNIQEGCVECPFAVSSNNLLAQDCIKLQVLIWDLVIEELILTFPIILLALLLGFVLLKASNLVCESGAFEFIVIFIEVLVVNLLHLLIVFNVEILGNVHVFEGKMLNVDGIYFE